MATKPAPETKAPKALYGFYRPHAPVTQDNSLVDHRTGEVTHPPSMTKQAHKDECDINKILKQYKQTGIVRHISAKAQQGQYVDLPEPMEFQDALHVVMRSEEAFSSLPSAVRSRFHNDPQEFLAFTSDPANAKEMADLGLTTPPPPTPPPMRVEVVNPVQEPSPTSPPPK